MPKRIEPNIRLMPASALSRQQIAAELRSLSDLITRTPLHHGRLAWSLDRLTKAAELIDPPEAARQPR